MKRITLKTVLRLFVLFICLGSLNSEGKAQIGGKLKEKAKEKIGSKKEETNTGASESTSSSEKTGLSTSNASSKANPGWYNVNAPTCVFSSDYGFGEIKTSFESGQNIFVRFAFPKSVGETFKDLMELSDIPSTGKLSLAIAKNIDDENPIIIYSSDIFTSRYTKDNVIDFTLQADEKTIELIGSGSGDVEQKVCFNSRGTMGNSNLSTLWSQQAKSFTKGSKDWEIFLIFSPWNSDDESKVKLAAQGKFKFTYDPDKNRSLYAAQMKPGQPVQDDGMTSDIHKKFAKQIVFSKSDISQTNASESNLTTTFNLGDDIYARIFMEKSHLNEVRAIGGGDYYASSANNTLLLKMMIDGKPAKFAFIGENTPEDAIYNAYEIGNAYQAESNEQTRAQKSTTILYNLSRQFKVEGNYVYDRLILDFMYAMQNLSVGSHKVKLELVFDIPSDGATADQQYTSAFGDEKTLASGEFTINVTEAGKVTAAKKLCATIADLKLYNGKLVKEPNAFKYVSSGVDETKFTLKKVVESDTNWYYHKNYKGIITHRTIHAVAFIEDKTTKLWSIRTVLFTQQNNSSGGSVYGGSTWEWGGTSEAFCKECLGL